jgi:lipopolysaccharide/colanic/teichoic acid biosynthesis glycosyltransferase
MIYKKYIKRTLDFTLSLLAIIIFLPLFLCLIILLFLSNGKQGVFFYQDRPGRNGKVFKVIKFKTMNDKKDSQGDLLTSIQRITKVGRFVRQYSLDEIPQLFNVLKGDMSIIGPRPLLVQYLLIYDHQQARRHEIRPGITGWAQVNGRNAISWKKKFELDVWYIDNISFILDLNIFLLTIKKIFKSSDINANNDSTMPTFNGDN